MRDMTASGVPPRATVRPWTMFSAWYSAPRCNRRGRTLREQFGFGAGFSRMDAALSASLLPTAREACLTDHRENRGTVRYADNSLANRIVEDGLHPSCC